MEKKPEEITSVISALIYCMRLLLAYKATKHDGPFEQIFQHILSNLCTDQDTVFTELFIIKLHGRQIANDFYGKPLIRWGRDLRFFSFRGSDIEQSMVGASFLTVRI